MKKVLISTKPKWCEDIASDKKKIEVRKSRPKIETPFKCLIYCTKDKYKHLYDLRPFTNGTLSLTVTEHNSTSLVAGNYWNGKVIGEFVCDRIVGYCPCGLCGLKLSNEVLKNMCLSNKDLNEYGKLDRVYGWHISDLKIYDKPKELSEFYRPCPEYYSDYYNGVCSEACVFHEEGFCKNFCLPQTRPPQSWCYVE